MPGLHMKHELMFLCVYMRWCARVCVCVCLCACDVSEDLEEGYYTPLKLM